MFAELLSQRCGSELSTAQISLLQSHYELLQRWNRSLNLTTITNLEEVVERHYCESLLVGQVLDPGPQRIVDIGSGAGFPGFPVAILRPDCVVTLVESHQRKAVFLKEASRGVRNVRVVAKRAEAVEESFDWVISRAVSYEDLSPVLPRLAPRFALLTGVDPPAPGGAYAWDAPIRLGPGVGRFLRVGRLREAG